MFGQKERLKVKDNDEFVSLLIKFMRIEEMKEYPLVIKR